MRAMTKAITFVAIGVSCSWANVAVGQDVNAGAKPHITYKELRALPLPVTDGDIVDRPYKVIGRVEATVRKSTIFSDVIGQEKAYKELWERAVKLRADAVVNAWVGKGQHSAFKGWGAKTATGDAIRFVDQ